MNTEWNDAELRELAHALPVTLPSAERLQRMRAQVVAQGSALRKQRRIYTATAAALALAAAAVIGLGLRQPASVTPPVVVALPVAHQAVPAPIHHEPPPPRNHGTVTADPGSRYSLVSGAPDELVVLEAGRLHVEVSPLGAGERFRVGAGDGEVEVRGTAFDVAVEADHLKRVTVEHGRVEVRTHDTGGVATVLGAGESWSAHATASALGKPAALIPTHGVDEPTPAPPTTVPEKLEPLPEPAPSRSVVLPAPSPLPRTEDSRERAEDRRERREERRERQDQRRYR